MVDAWCGGEAVRQVGDDKSSRTAQSKPEEDMRRRMRHQRNIFFSLDGEEKSGENAASFLHFPQTRDSKFWWDGRTLLYSTESPDSFLALFFASLAMV